MIDVTPSKNPYNNADIRATVTVEKNESLRDGSPDLIPPKQSDTQLKMAKLGKHWHCNF